MCSEHYALVPTEIKSRLTNAHANRDREAWKLARLEAIDAVTVELEELATQEAEAAKRENAQQNLF